MRILQLMPQSPLPTTDGGKVGIWNITKQMALAGNTVHCVFYSMAPTVNPGHPNIRFTRVPRSVRNTIPRIAGSIFYNTSLFVHKHTTQAMKDAISEIMATESFDVIHADHTCMGLVAQWASARYNVPWGLRLHNVEWMIWKRYAERFTRWHPARWYLRSQAEKLRWDEADILRYCTLAFPITDVDLERARELAAGTRFVVAPAGVDIPQYTGQPKIQTDLVMASSWTWVHNADGLRWFVTEVWPLVRNTFPQATFGVLGTNPPAWLADYADVGIKAEGFVEDLYERLRCSLVYVAPLFVGSGVRIKVLEALGAGLPVVGTSVSAEGIDISEEEGLFQADDARGTANAIVNLLLDKGLRSRIFVAARACIEQRYTWTSSVGTMLLAYADILNEPKE